MQLFIKTLTGKTITIEVEPSSTVLDIKQAIYKKEDIDVDMQRLIIGGKQCEDHRKLHEYPFQKYTTTHLVVRNFRPEVDFKHHQLYVAVHNFYDEPGSNHDLHQMRGETGQFQYVFDIEAMLRKGFTMEEIFEQAIEVRNLRAKKNARANIYDNENAINGQSTCSLSIIAIDKDQIIIAGESSSILGNTFEEAATLMCFDEDVNLANIPYSIVASVQPDNTIYMPRVIDSEVEQKVCRPFRQQVSQHIIAKNFVNPEAMRVEFQQALSEQELFNEEDRPLAQVNIAKNKKINRKATYMSQFTYQFVATLDFLEYGAEEINAMEEAGILDALCNSLPIEDNSCVTYGLDETNLLAPNAIRDNARSWVLVMNNIRRAIDGDEISDEALQEEVAQFAQEMVQLVVNRYRNGDYEVSFEDIKEDYLNKEALINVNDSGEIVEEVNDAVGQNINLVNEGNVTKYLMLDHGGVLDGQVIMNADDIKDNDLVLEAYDWGGYQVLKNGVDIVNHIDQLIELHDYKLVFHSKNKENDQILILKQLQYACQEKGVMFPNVHAMAVKDTDLYPNTFSDGPQIFINDEGILVAAWGVDDFDGKASVRRALESALNIDEAQRNQHIVFDDGKPNVILPRDEGYQAFLIGGPESEGIELHEAITQVHQAAVDAPIENGVDEIIFIEQQELPQKLSWDNIALKVRQEISLSCQTIRHEQGLTSEQYWNTLSYEEQQQWVSYVEHGIEEKVNDEQDTIAEFYLNEIIGYLKELRNNYDAKDHKSGGLLMFKNPSPASKHAALTRLILGLQGEVIDDLTRDLDSIFRADNIGSRIRSMVKQGYASIALGRDITTVTEFITSVQEKVNLNAQMTII